MVGSGAYNAAARLAGGKGNFVRFFDADARITLAYSPIIFLSWAAQLYSGKELSMLLTALVGLICIFIYARLMHALYRISVIKAYIISTVLCLVLFAIQVAMS